VEDIRDEYIKLAEPRVPLTPWILSADVRHIQPIEPS
jgi:hypothetical protein